MNLFPIAQGFILGAGMIIPIGAQNAFVLNQGIKRQYHLVAATICVLSDFILIAVGIYGGSQIISSSELAFTLLTWTGILFLIGYGFMSFRAAMAGVYERQSELKSAKTLSKVVIACLAVTLLNPHVYIDTVVILGGVGGQFEGDAKVYFAFGCMIASMVWFYGLAVLSARMSDVLRRTNVKRGIDIAVGLIMLGIAGSLFWSWYYGSMVISSAHQ